MVASITPAWTAATTSSPGCARTTSRTASEARIHELAPALTARGDRQGGIAVPVGDAEGGDHVLPCHPVGLAGVQLAQVAPLAHGSERRGSGPDDRPEPLCRLDGPGQDGRIEGGGVAQLPRLVEAVGQRRHLPVPEIGQPRASLWPTDDPAHVALRLAVTDQYDARRPLHRRNDPEDSLVGALLAHARLPTKRSSWRSVRHSTTSSQWAAYSPTMESPDPQ